MLVDATQATPRLNTEVVDLYHVKLKFIVDSHTIHLKPRGLRKNDWAIGLYRMNAQEIEDVIKGFNDEMTKALEDAISGIVPVDTAPFEDIGPLDPVDKGKGKVGGKRKTTEGTSAAAKKKKKVTIAPTPPEVAMTEDEYDLIAARIQEQMNKRFNAMQTLQDQL